MIALEILDYFRSEQIANGCTPFLLEMYNEAIAELEEAMKPKSCENCVSWETGRKTISTCLLGVCDGTCFSTKGDFMFEVQVIHGTHKDFCCNKHEPKEQ